MAAKKKEVVLQSSSAFLACPVGTLQPLVLHIKGPRKHRVVSCSEDGDWGIINPDTHHRLTNINSQELWEEMLCLKGLIVVDAFQSWCGPCKTVVDLFRKIRNEVSSDLLHFAVAEVDSIDALEKYRGKCEPVFLFYAGGELVAVVRGANAPLLQKTILEQLAMERKVLEHGGERVVVTKH